MQPTPWVESKLREQAAKTKDNRLGVGPHLVSQAICDLYLRLLFLQALAAAVKDLRAEAARLRGEAEAQEPRTEP